MSEPMEVKVNVNEWRLCEHMAAAGPDGRIACIYRDGEGNVRVEMFSVDSLATRLRPAPKPEAKVDADGWEVVESSEGANGIFCRRYSQSSCYVWEYLLPNLGVLRGYPHGASFPTEAAALAAMAVWRAKNSAKPKPSPLTAEQEAAVREIVRDVMNAPTFDARSV